MNNPLPHSSAPRLEGVQVLRFLAAVLVMVAHSKLVLREHEIPSSWDASIAACGVDVFFVISGFVIAMSAARARSAWSFLVDRALRVLPLYFLVSALFVAKRVVSGEEITGGVLVNSVLFLPWLDHGAYGGTYHPYGWSIAFEMWFYGLLALLLVFVSRARAPLVCAAVLSVGCVAVGLGYRGEWLLPEFAFSPLVLEFAAGCVLYALRDKVRAYAWHACALLPVFVGGIWFTSYLGYPGEVIGVAHLGFARALIWGGFAVCVFVLCYAAEKKMKWPASLVALGTASYSIYLIQPFVVRLGAALPLPPLPRVAGFMALSVALGWLMYVWLERPLLSRAKAWIAARSAPLVPVVPVLPAKAGLQGSTA
jgi:exopolysaccharide production protein ExoZ